jgi:hypothetical protein
MPLAVLGKFSRKTSVATSLGDVMHAVFQRLSRETSPPGAAKLLTASYVLSGLRLPKKIVDSVFEGVRGMKESTTYQGIIEEGRIDQTRRLLVRLGGKRFGKPSVAVQAAIDGVTDLDKLERMTDRLMTAKNWRELVEMD